MPWKTTPSPHSRNVSVCVRYAYTRFAMSTRCEHSERKSERVSVDNNCHFVSHETRCCNCCVATVHTTTLLPELVGWSFSNTCTNPYEMCEPVYIFQSNDSLVRSPSLSRTNSTACRERVRLPFAFTYAHMRNKAFVAQSVNGYYWCRLPHSHTRANTHCAIHALGERVHVPVPV